MSLVPYAKNDDERCTARTLAGRCVLIHLHPNPHVWEKSR